MDNFVERMKEQINSIALDDQNLYLISKINEKYCFLYKEKIIYFGKKTDVKSNNSMTETAYISLLPEVFIDRIGEGNSLESGYYDLLAYHENLNDIYFDIFCEICLSYANDKSNKYNFYLFFEKLVEIFKDKRPNIYTDVVGLMGELLLIKEIYEKYQVNLGKYWHNPGSNSKFDFSLEDFNIEVKTTTKSDTVFLLKHSQIFNNQKIYLAVISLIETGKGDSINSLKDYFYEKPIFSQDIDFQIKLQKEISKINDEIALDRGFSLENLNMYLSDNIPTIKNIPECINNIEYEYDFSYIDQEDIKKIFEI